MYEAQAEEAKARYSSNLNVVNFLLYLCILVLRSLLSYHLLPHILTSSRYLEEKAAYEGQGGGGDSD